VIDYKTGQQREKKKATFDGGRALQLPLYLHGAAHLLKRKPEDGTAEYFYVSRRGRFARHDMTGAKLAVSEQGELFGSVSGGCVESDVAATAAEVLADATPRLLTYGIADEQAWSIGLPCGGEIDVFVEPLE